MSEQEKDAIIAAQQLEITILKSVLRKIPGNIYWKTKDDIILGCNDNSAKAIQLNSPDEIVGKRGVDLYPPDLASKIIEIDRKVMEGGKEISFEEPGVADGKPAIYLSRKSPFYDDKGELIGIIGISVDITQRKKDEEALRIARKKAEEASQAKTKFLAMVSHEFRIPLTSIIGFANFLQRGMLSEEERQTYIEYLVQSSQYLLSLVNKLLDFSKLEADKMELALAPLDIRSLVFDVKGMLTSVANAKNIPLYLEYDSNIPEMLVSDAKLLRQILINLLGNAIKFTHKGSVTIKVSCLEMDLQKAKLEFLIQDTGVGIPANKQKAIFKEFYQVDDIYTRATGNTGTGLGLAIVKKLIKLLGGQIQVKSKVNVGSTFSFVTTFPIYDNRNKEVNKINIISRETSAAFQDIKVLLVEDDVLVQFVHKKMLTELGCRVDTAENAKKALEMINDDYEIIFVDIGLPDLNGFDLIQQMRGHLRLYEKMPAIAALTGFCTSEERERCLKVGADIVLLKPVSQEALKSEINRIMSKVSSYSSKNNTIQV